MFNQIKATLLELVFPASCVLCKKAGPALCADCLNEIDRPLRQMCPLCEQVTTPRGKVCKRCQSRKRPPLDSLIVAGDYQNKKLRQAVHLFKYKFIRDLAQPLGELAATGLTTGLNESRSPLADFIVPIPLHPKRLRWRGFNQAELLAEEIRRHLKSKNFDLKLVNDLVIRQRYTPPQMKIADYAARQENLKNAFCLNEKHQANLHSWRNKKILLVDDVCTTGATLFNCAKALKQLRPQSIDAVALGRQK